MIDNKIGRNIIRPWAQIVYIALLLSAISLSISYPFPLTLKDIPRNSQKAFSAEVIESHEDGILRGWHITSSEREAFSMKDSEADGAVLRQMRKFDLSHSIVFKFTYRCVLLLCLGMWWFSRYAIRRWPDLPPVRTSETVDSLTEYKMYMETRHEALLGRYKYKESARISKGDPWYRMPYWNEIAMAVVVLLCLSTGYGFWRYLNPKTDENSNVNVKSAIQVMR